MTISFCRDHVEVGSVALCPVSQCGALQNRLRDDYPWVSQLPRRCEWALHSFGISRSVQ